MGTVQKQSPLMEHSRFRGSAEATPKGHPPLKAHRGRRLHDIYTRI